MKLIRRSLTLAAILCLTNADYLFHSRPDLYAPKLNITVPAAEKAVEEGLIFIAPYQAFTSESFHTGPIQPGAYIYRHDGELVWSGLGYCAGWVANLVPDTWNGRPYLRAFQGSIDAVFTQGRMYGFHTLLDPTYKVVKTLTAGSHRLASAHEFNLKDGKTALIETPVAVVTSLKPWGGDESQNWIVSHGFQEIDIDTNEVLFEWYSLDHIDPKYSGFPLDSKILPGSGRNVTDGWNYVHINSVDKDSEGNYLISARHVGAVFKINGTTGDIIYQLGGLSGGSDFTINDEDKFAYQHHARFRGRSPDGSKEIISLFDNSAYTVHGGPPIKTHPHSRGRIYELDLNRGTAKAIRTYNPPEPLLAGTQGSLQVLPNGNVFINWGEAGAITEYSYDGDVLFHSRLDSAPHGVLVQSYRGFKANWTGIPAEEPALIVVKSQDGPEVDAYVSWNGDTESRAWAFYAVSESEQATEQRLLGKVERSGFETHGRFSLEEAGRRIVAEAIDKEGNVLRRTRVAEVKLGLDHVFESPRVVRQWPEVHEYL